MPAFIERTAKLRRAVNDVVLSKSFDNGMVCASEQAVILDEPIYDAAMAEFAALHAYRCNPTEKAALERFIFGAEAADGVALLRGQAQRRRRRAEPACGSPSRPVSPCRRRPRSSWPRSPSVGRHEPLTREKLCPVLAVLRAEDAEHGIEPAPSRWSSSTASGHSAAIHTEDDAAGDRVRPPGARRSGSSANSPTSHGRHR